MIRMSIGATQHSHIPIDLSARRSSPENDRYEPRRIRRTKNAGKDVPTAWSIRTAPHTIMLTPEIKMCTSSRGEIPKVAYRGTWRPGVSAKCKRSGIPRTENLWWCIFSRTNINIVLTGTYQGKSPWILGYTAGQR